jgi:hypothetical protein
MKEWNWSTWKPPVEALAALSDAKDQLRDSDQRDFVIDIREGAGPVVLRVSLSLRVGRNA